MSLFEDSDFSTVMDGFENPSSFVLPKKDTYLFLFYLAFLVKCPIIESSNPLDSMNKIETHPITWSNLKVLLYAC
jgi:hypothetical protein